MSDGLRPGRYVLAPPAAYRIAALDGEDATCVVVAGSRAVRDRAFVWPLANLRAALRLGEARVADRRPPLELDEHRQGDLLRGVDDGLD